MPSGPEIPRPYVALFAALERLAVRELAAATLTAMRIKLGLRPPLLPDPIEDDLGLEDNRVDERRVQR